jgi:ComF family protein
MLNYLCLEKCRQCGVHLDAAPLQPQTACDSCWDPLIEADPISDFCTMASEPLLIVSASPYQGVLKKLVYKLKYDNDGLVASDLVLLLERAWRKLAGCIQLGADAGGNGIDVLIIPVPLHWWRQWRRGFNQTHLLAKMLAARLRKKKLLEKNVRVSVNMDILKRKSATKAHHGLGRAERMVNVTGAFSARTYATCANSSSERIVVLLDDIYTSGATMSECARVLRMAGYKHIYGLTVARALEPGSTK